MKRMMRTVLAAFLIMLVWATAGQNAWADKFCKVTNDSRCDSSDISTPLKSLNISLTTNHKSGCKIGREILDGENEECMRSGKYYIVYPGPPQKFSYNESDCKEGITSFALWRFDPNDNDCEVDAEISWEQRPC